MPDTGLIIIRKYKKKECRKVIITGPSNHRFIQTKLFQPKLIDFAWGIGLYGMDRDGNRIALYTVSDPMDSRFRNYSKFMKTMHSHPANIWIKGLFASGRCPGEYFDLNFDPQCWLDLGPRTSIILDNKPICPRK